MQKNRAVVLPLLMVAGLAACERHAAKTPPPGDSVAQTSVRGAQMQAATSKAAPADAQAVSVDTLPLRRGYYVADDTPCDEAANATVTLLRRDGIGGSRDFCEFTKIVQIGPASYRVTQSCNDLQNSGPPDISVVTYTVTGDTSFSSRSEHGWEYRARYCAQSSMPPEWRHNDISDAIR